MSKPKLLVVRTTSTAITVDIILAGAMLSARVVLTLIVAKSSSAIALIGLTWSASIEYAAALFVHVVSSDA